MISEAKRFFLYAKEYIHLRRPSVNFFEYEVLTFEQKSSNVTFGRKITELIEAERRDCNSEIYISLQYSREKPEKYY